MIRLRRLALSFAACLAACQSSGTVPESPALLISPEPMARAELLTVLGELSGFSGILLPADAFVTEPVLTLARRHQYDDKGELLQGRDLEQPQRFMLLGNATGQCWLRSSSSGVVRRLEKARCRVQ